MRSTPTFNFQDISGTGTFISLADDEVSGAIPLGFSFSFFGTSYTGVYVSSNGFITLLLDIEFQRLDRFLIVIVEIMNKDSGNLGIDAKDIWKNANTSIFDALSNQMVVSF